VLIGCGYITEKDVPDDFIHKKSIEWTAFGGSGIVSPRGHYVAGPVYDEETIIYGEIDMGEIPLAKCALDMVGHYARWDVLNLNLNKQPHLPYWPVKHGAEALPTEEYAELKQAIEELAAQIRVHPCPELLAAADNLLNKAKRLQGLTD